MAVRIAFLEQNESTRIPLLIDDAFGTCDDDRTSVIIQTVMEIARQGRQIFFFTAQKDEVGKWISHLEATGVAHKIFNLAEIRRIANAESNPLPVATIEIPEPPAPNGMDYSQYGRALHIPGLDPTALDQDRVHLWHLLNDAHQLYEYMRKGIVWWNQLRTLYSYSAMRTSMTASEPYNRASVAMKAVRAACEAWRVGRGRAVDRMALLESGCVSNNFIDELSELASDLRGDAGAILAALEAGDVKRWRTAATENLRDYFEANGYLTLDEPLSTEEIRARVVAAVTDDLEAGLIDRQVIERIIASLPIQCAGEEMAATASDSLSPSI